MWEQSSDDFNRKWGNCFVRIKDSGFTGMIYNVGRQGVNIITKQAGTVVVPYKPNLPELVDFAIPQPGYYQLGSHTWYLMRTGMRQFQRGLGGKNYFLQSPINANFSSWHENNISKAAWDIGRMQIDFAEADAILSQQGAKLNPQKLLELLSDKNNKVFVSLALSRKFAASLSPFHNGLLLYLWNKYVADVSVEHRVVRVINPIFGQEVSDFVRDNTDYRCVNGQ